MPSRCLLVPLLLMLAACSPMQSRDAAVQGLPVESVNLARQQALRLRELAEQQLPTAEVRQETEGLRQQLSQFDDAVIRIAVGLEQQQQWRSAEQVFYQVLRQVPDRPVLREALLQFDQRRELHEEIVRTELAIHKGEQLLKDADTYRRLRQLKPGLFSWLEVNRYRGQCRRSAADLQRYAHHAIEREDYYLARRGLAIAQRLYGDETPSGQLAADLALAQQYINDRGRRVGKIGSKTRTPDDLIAGFQDALQSGKLLTARQSLSQLQQQYPGHKQLVSFRSQLQVRTTLQVDAAIEQGRDLYSDGKVNQALTIWREARQLDPDNAELLSSIARAEKVLQNLRVLSSEKL